MIGRETKPLYITILSHSFSKYPALEKVASLKKDGYAEM